MKKTILISYYIKLFEQGIYFVPEMLIAAKAMLGAMSMPRAGVDFKFHDLRNCAINNLRLAGNDHFRIKKVSRHKTDIAFHRYNLVTEEEMLGMKWLDLKKDEHRTMDTKAISRCVT